MSPIETQVRAFLADAFPTAGDAPLAVDTSLFEAGIIDSMGVLTLVTWLEETYGFTVDDDEVLPENIDGIGALVRYIGRKSGA
ncbi:MAG: acyl carrier protein [Xanthomonadales bacterium]|nr:acyl carrier protein [Xanthomonadales bacterium]